MTPNWAGPVDVSGIGDDRENDRHGARRLQQRPYGRGARCQNDVWRKCGQLCRVFANSGDIDRGSANLNSYVAAIDPTQLLQRLPECTDPDLIVRIVRGCGQEHADMPKLAL